MATITRTVTVEETMTFTEKEVMNAIRSLAVDYNGKEWDQASVSIHKVTLPVVMGQIDDRDELLAVVKITKIEDL